MMAIGATPGGTGASAGVFDFSSGYNRFFSYGANVSTKGAFSFLQKSSDESLGNTPIEVLTGGNVLLAQTGGNVGIGDATPNDTLVVNGNIWADNFYQTSDMELKTDIIQIDNSSDRKLYKYKLNKSKPVFELKNKTPVQIGTEYYAEDEQIGLMANELGLDYIKDVGDGWAINLYSVIARNFVDIGKLFDRVTQLEGGNISIGKGIGIGTELITFNSNPQNQTNVTTYSPTISTMNETNITITSSGGSVIIKLG